MEKTVRITRWLGLPLALLGASLVLGRGGATARQGPPRGTDPLVALNDRFHDAYRQARIDRLAESGPVVLVGFNSLALLRQGGRTEVPFPPTLYHKLKEVAHVPLLTYVLLEGIGGEPFDAVRRAEVVHVRDLVLAALEGLDRSGFPASSLDRQRTILKSTWSYLVDVLNDGKAPSVALEAFAKRAAPLMLANADEAAEAHLTLLNGQMEAWRREMTPEEWRSMHVVVMSVHMARDREIAMQYFATPPRRSGRRAPPDLRRGAVRGVQGPRPARHPPPRRRRQCRLLRRRIEAAPRPPLRRRNQSSRIDDDPPLNSRPNHPDPRSPGNLGALGRVKLRRIRRLE